MARCFFHEKFPRLVGFVIFLLGCISRAQCKAVSEGELLSPLPWSDGMCVEPENDASASVCAQSAGAGGLLPLCAVGRALSASA